jgi:predicted RecB family endonuclease
MAKEAIDLVIENSVALQKVVAELAVNLKKLSSDVSEMVNLFKDATKTMSSEKAEKETGNSEIEELKAKVDELVEQNKIIAKGILLLESSLKPKTYPSY